MNALDTALHKSMRSLGRKRKATEELLKKLDTFGPQPSQVDHSMAYYSFGPHARESGYPQDSSDDDSVHQGSPSGIQDGARQIKERAHANDNEHQSQHVEGQGQSEGSIPLSSRRLTGTPAFPGTGGAWLASNEQQPSAGSLDYLTARRNLQMMGYPSEQLPIDDVKVADLYKMANSMEVRNSGIVTGFRENMLQVLSQGGACKELVDVDRIW